ncbi:MULTISPECIES: hypothetical protein [unclassified Lysobacter]|uniref:hypothetical protein n=1 Tax=unclassified Lysobacter TaxID=2635362 RepID=UPI001BEACF89|nr:MULTISPECIES: hypothetical protein [unclassified Lysobacter]MBT2748714.1 hypothetical protein [Lysobacter sp. ISL-42]MBT2751649.1 hypothetical protein [Lysobacter sp. ISL-50]MBT2775843.1 hypothetical protein [Lysobacter sp. ISL-54]MBT2782192.1 hypothetical protein [Lysobacter sp. ISL-52]
MGISRMPWLLPLACAQPTSEHSPNSGAQYGESNSTIWNRVAQYGSIGSGFYPKDISQPTPLCDPAELDKLWTTR